MDDRRQRSASLWPLGAVDRLRAATVFIAGLGGVGSWAMEGLARAGIGTFILLDGDVIEPSNLNRQLLADATTMGRAKAEVAAERLRTIDPDIRATALCRRLVAGDAADLLERFQPIDLVIDAIDDVRAKVDLIAACRHLDIPIVASMGMGNRRDPTRVRVADLADTHTDPLAKIVRRRLRDHGIEHLPVVFSEEPAITPDGPPGMIGSVPFVPPTGGFLMAWKACDILLNPR